MTTIVIERCRIGERLPVAMRGIGEAMALDETSRKSDAYIKYLSCAFYTVQALLDDVAGRDIGELSRDMCTKFFKLSEQCLDRAKDLMKELAETESVNPVHLDVQQRSSPQMHRSSSPTVLYGSRPGSPVSPGDMRHHHSFSTLADNVEGEQPVGVPSTTSLPLPLSRAMHSINPMEFAYRQNQHLIIAYRARMAKMGSEGARAKMNLTMLRRYQENMAIAKRRQDTLLAKIKERERRQKEAERNNSSAALGSVTSDRLVQMAEEFALKHNWVGGMQTKLASKSGDSSLVSDFIMKVLSFTDHPLARQLGTFQYNVYQQLLPLSRHLQKDSAHVTPPVDASLANSLNSLTSSFSFANKTIEVCEAHGTAAANAENMLSRLRADITNEPSDGWDTINKSVSSELIDNDDSELTDIFSHADSPTDDLPESENQSVEMPNSLTDSLTGRGLSSTVNKTAEEAEEFEYQEQLDMIVKDIHNYLDELLKGFMVCYRELDTPEGRDQCCSSIEQRFFPPIWSPLLAVIRRSKEGSERSLAAVMSAMYYAGPKHFDVQDRLCLGGESESAPDESIDENRLISIPYQKAIEQLKGVAEKKCPLEKLECVVSTSRCILESADDYWEEKGKGRQSKEATMGTDDLLPILTYVVVKTRLPQLVSECIAMEEFIHEGYLMGEEGYCLTTLNTAVLYGASLASKVC